MILDSIKCNIGGKIQHSAPIKINFQLETKINDQASFKMT